MNFNVNLDEIENAVKVVEELEAEENRKFASYANGGMDFDKSKVRADISLDAFAKDFTKKTLDVLKK